MLSQKSGGDDCKCVDVNVLACDIKPAFLDWIEYKSMRTRRRKTDVNHGE